MHYIIVMVVAQSCLTLWEPTNCSLPGSSVHGILQARIEWLAILFSRGSSWPRDQTQAFRITGRFISLRRFLNRCTISIFWQTSVSYFGEGNGNPLQISSLENPMNRGAWWVTVHGVAKSGIQLSTHTHNFLLGVIYVVVRISKLFGAYFSLLSSTYKLFSVHQFSSVQSLSHVWLFATPWIAAHQASLSITNSWSSLKLMSIESVMPFSHLILCHPFSSCPQSLPESESFPMSQLFAWGGQSNWSFSFSISPSNEHSGLISFRVDWLDLLAVQGTLKRLLQTTV